MKSLTGDAPYLFNALLSLWKMCSHNWFIFRLQPVPVNFLCSSYLLYSCCVTFDLFCEATSWWFCTIYSSFLLLQLVHVEGPVWTAGSKSNQIIGSINESWIGWLRLLGLWYCSFTTQRLLMDESDRCVYLQQVTPMIMHQYINE